MRKQHGLPRSQPDNEGSGYDEVNVNAPHATSVQHAAAHEDALPFPMWAMFLPENALAFLHGAVWQIVDVSLVGTIGSEERVFDVTVESAALSTRNVLSIGNSIGRSMASAVLCMVRQG